ncbi:MAG: glycogen synthase GlgA [Nitrospinae bacterium]|nr:glycogen synthase GlgA [Nitrospinota bacterium]MBL7020483.1 glycogen synthase GlgA [Nitrospinaceae bacterium]
MKLKILLVSAEVYPFAKTGGLADVSGALPPALKKLGHDIRVIMPKYPCTAKAGRKIQSLKIDLSVPGHDQKGSLFKSELADRVPLYLVEHDGYFNRKHIYGEPGTDYPDSVERFSFFSQAVLEAVKSLDFKPDIIHCNDWHTGLIPVYLKSLYRKDPWFSQTKTLFSIHNLGYQGNFPHSHLKATGLDESLFKEEGLEFYGQISFLKGGLIFADTLSTVSPAYSHEIQTPELGFGMEGILQKRSDCLYGILNGVDETIWNPKTDPLIPANYGPKSLSQKKQCREDLIKTFSLRLNKKTPLLCMITRLSQQKGIDLIVAAKDALDKLDISLVILGTGSTEYEAFFKQWSRNRPGKIATALKFDESLGHRILAGSDMLLMPSRYEPCGLTQMYALKYGTVPIVRAVGGLKDSIQEFSDKTGKGTGFKFKIPQTKFFLKSLQKALSCFHQTKTWKKLMLNGMAKDNSWEFAAKKYSRLYQKSLRS